MPLCRARQAVNLQLSPGAAVTSAGNSGEGCLVSNEQGHTRTWQNALHLKAQTN